MGFRTNAPRKLVNRTRMRTEMQTLRAEVSTEMQTLRAEVNTEMQILPI